MSHIFKATELKLFAKFHDDWSKQSVSNATSPNYANYEVIHALACLRIIYSYFEKGCRKNVHATIPRGSMGYVQYAVPDTVAVEPTFVAFL